MLARAPIEDTYLSAEQLGIREDEREALIWVRDELASGRIEYDPKAHCYEDGGRGFTMATSVMTGCGTVACIGGWMALRLDRAWEALPHNKMGSALFVPDNWSNGKHTPAQAVRAIDAWLTGAGDRCWHVALENEA